MFSEMAKKTIQSNASERLFAELCAQIYLKGFVFHSPRFKAPTEQEAGDVVLWVRTELIVFEILSRDPCAFGSTKSFIKQIGRKRDQLIRDSRVYSDSSKSIIMLNEMGETISYDHDCFVKDNFRGVVIVDADTYIEKLHFETVSKSLQQEFPIAIMTKRDFIDLLSEIDTIPDLLFYLKDRKTLLDRVFKDEPKYFLDLNLHTERNLIGFYKLHDNSFPVEEWKSSADQDLWLKYQRDFAVEIESRDKDNVESFIFDEIVDLLRNSNKPDNSTLLHSWELAVLPRRFRAGLAKRLKKAFDEMMAQRSVRHFAFYNSLTGCWSLFYFRYGGDTGSFIEETERLAKMKMRVERVQRKFQYSVFSFAFRKSSIITGNTFDECVLRIEDAKEHATVLPQDYQVALKYFRGNTGEQKIYEFPP
jgi:hypothetical protein